MTPNEIAAAFAAYGPAVPSVMASITTSVDAREYLRQRTTGHLTGLPRTRRLARKLLAREMQSPQLALNPHLSIGTGTSKKGAGRPARVFYNITPLLMLDIPTGMTDRTATEEDDAPEITGLPVWLDDIISGSLVWSDGKGTHHKLSPYWMQRIITKMPIISTARVAELTQLKKSAVAMYTANVVLACQFIRAHVMRQERDGDSVENSPIVGKETDLQEVSPIQWEQTPEEAASAQVEREWNATMDAANDDSWYYQWAA